MRNTRTTGLLPPRNRTRCVIASPIRSQQTNFPNTCVSGTQVSFTCRCRYSFEICSEFSRVRAAVVRLPTEPLVLLDQSIFGMNTWQLCCCPATHLYEEALKTTWQDSSIIGVMFGYTSL